MKKNKMYLIIISLIFMGCNNNDYLNKSIFDNLTQQEKNNFYLEDSTMFKYYLDYEKYILPEINDYNKTKYYNITIKRFINFFKYYDMILKENKYESVDSLTKVYDLEMYNVLNEFTIKTYDSEQISIEDTVVMETLY